MIAKNATARVMAASDKSGVESSSESGGFKRGLRAIEFLQAAEAPVSATKLADVLGCEPSSALRLLRTLVSLDYAVRDEATKLYYPGPKALLPLSLYHPVAEFRRDLSVALNTLREDTSLTVAGVLFTGRIRLVVDIIHGSERLSPFYETHLTRPIHSSATGKVFLWSLPPSSWPSVLGPEPYPSLAPNTRTTQRALQSEMEAAQARGYAQTCDESVIGLSGVAAPVRNKAGAIMSCIGAFGLTRGKANPKDIAELGVKTKLAADLFGQLAPSVQNVSRLFSMASASDRG